MNRGIYTGAAAMAAAERRLEAVTTNLANLETPGFRGLRAATRAFTLPENPEETDLRTEFTVRHEQGEIVPSGSPTHLALDGPGFFAIEGAEGELYTRRGTFHLTGDGALVTEEGHPVVWEGATGRIDPAGEPLVIDETGAVRQGTRSVGKLRIVAFEDPGALEVLGGELFRAPATAIETAPAARVHQGALERSNVSSIDALVELVQVQRGFEAASRLVQIVSQSYARLLERR